jgi:hypothetical protein
MISKMTLPKVDQRIAHMGGVDDNSYTRLLSVIASVRIALRLECSRTRHPDFEPAQPGTIRPAP